MVKATYIRADDLVIGLQQVGVDKALDAVSQERIVVNGFVGGFGDLEHDARTSQLTWAKLR